MRRKDEKPRSRETVTASVTKPRRAFFFSLFVCRGKKYVSHGRAPETTAFRGLPFLSTPFLTSVRCICYTAICSGACRNLCAKKCTNATLLAKQYFLLQLDAEHLPFATGSSGTVKQKADLLAVSTLCISCTWLGPPHPPPWFL